jgi:hypothetical protein
LAELELATADHALKFLAQYGRVRVGERGTVVLVPIKLHDVKRILTHDGGFREVKEIRSGTSEPLIMTEKVTEPKIDNERLGWARAETPSKIGSQETGFGESEIRNEV